MDGVGHQLLRVGQFHDAALVDDCDAVRNVAHHREIMGDEQVGDAALLLQAAQQVEHLGADGHVQSADGLIGHDEFRLHDERTGNADALPLAAGKFVGKAGSKFRQQAHVQQSLPHFFFPLGGGEVGPHVLQALAHDVAHLGALVQRGLRVLKDHLNLTGDLLVQRTRDFAVDLLALVQDLTARGGQNAQDGPADGGLAGAGLAHQTKGLALVDLEIGVLYGGKGLAAGAVGHIQVLHFQKDFFFLGHLTSPPFAVFSPQQAARCGVPGGPAARSWPCGWAKLQSTAGA